MNKKMILKIFNSLPLQLSITRKIFDHPLVFTYTYKFCIGRGFSQFCDFKVIFKICEMKICTAKYLQLIHHENVNLILGFTMVFSNQPFIKGS